MEIENEAMETRLIIGDDVKRRWIWRSHVARG